MKVATWKTLFLIIPFILLASYSFDGRAATAQKVDTSRLFVEYKNDSLTVKAEDVLLGTILEEIVTQTGIEMILRASAEEPVSTAFSDLPLERGLKRLTRNFNHVFIYGPKSEKVEEAVIKAVIIYPKTGEVQSKKATRRVITPKKQSLQHLQRKSFESLVQLLHNKNPELREDAAALLARSKDKRALPHLIEALRNDDNEDVRISAAEALGSLGDSKAIDPLSEALRDTDADVRESAVDALAEIGGAEVIEHLMAASKDDDEDVRDAAEEALGEINGKDFSR